MEWEREWHRPPEMPELGDYIQAKGIYSNWAPSHIAEGTVIEVKDDAYNIMPADLNAPVIYAARWRRGILPEKDKKVRKKEKAV